MLTISKALSSVQAQSYHKLEFTSESQNYYKQGDSIKGEWQGQLSSRFGLAGEVSPLEFSRLADGIHPQTEEQLVRHRSATEYRNADGTITKAAEHCAGWDATFSAPKSVSLTALVGGDDRVLSFLSKLNPDDCVLVIGDTRQHQGVEAGRPFQQMQEAGMQTSHLDKIMRQKDPGLLRAVMHLAKDETEKGIAMLAEQGRVTEIPNGRDRIAAIARDYASQPDKTIIVSPDNRSRQQINEAVRIELRKAGVVAEDGQKIRTLTHRSDMTGADRTWAARYNVGDILQYTAGSKGEEIERNSLATVQSINARSNLLTVVLKNGSTASYDPRRLRGVNVFRDAEREFAAGDRVQFTAPNRDLGVANRDLGTVTGLKDGQMTLRMDGRSSGTITLDSREFRQFDHGYAVTSHSSQGLTAARVLAHFDTESNKSLINSRLPYVAISRASEDARIYTNDAATLGQRLSTDISKTAALEHSAPVHALERVTKQTSVQDQVVRVPDHRQKDFQDLGIGL